MSLIHECTSDRECKKILQAALKKGVDITKDVNPMMMASTNGWIESMKLLLKNGADVTVYSNNCVGWADLYDHKKMVRLLLDNGATLPPRIMALYQ